jgi:hypothetical protein
MAVGKPGADERRRFSPYGKLAMITAVLAVGLLWWGALARHNTAALPGALIIAGLLLGGAGDVILSGLLPIRQPIIPGMAAFSLGHLAYAGAILAFWQPGQNPTAVQAAAALALCAALVFLGWRRWISPSRAVSARTRIATLAYGLLLFSVTVLSLLFAVGQGHLWVLFAGLLLFLISDMLLVSDLLDLHRFPLIGDMIWIIYSSGQLLIACAIGAGAAAM